MKSLTSHAPMTALLRERGTFDRYPFVLVDVGCGGSIDGTWRVFGPSLVARAYDPDVAACEEAQARESFENVRYEARHVGLSEAHPFVQRRAADAAQWPDTNIWGRITAGHMAARAAAEATPAPARPMADPDAVIGVGEIVRTESLPTVDFLEIEAQGRDFEVLESARDVLADSRVLGVGMNVNWFGTASPTENTFHNTDRFLRERGFTLFGITLRRYSRVDLPAPFELEMFTQTRFGQPYQGDAIYLRDLAADHLADAARNYPTDKLIKLACLYELAGLPDCAAEVLNHFASRLRDFGDRRALLDALTPPLHGEQLSYREYIARFKRHPEAFLPSAGDEPVVGSDESNEAGASSTARTAIARRISRRIRPERLTSRLDDVRRMDRAGLRERFLKRAPRGVVHAAATALARGRPLALDPGWRFHVPGDDEPELTLLKRDIWMHYREDRIETPVVFRWYDGLRLRLYLGNDLSLCLFVLGAFEPNEFVFLNRVLEPGMVVLDGGANEGLFSIYAGRRVGPDGTVLAVEPSAREFSRLEANVELNRLDNVTTFKLALGNRVGQAVLAVADSDHAGMNAIEAEGPDREGAPWTQSHERVPTDTIDCVAARVGLARLDLVKLDIEGSEVDALVGARTAISRFHPVILVEAEEVRLASQGRSKQDLLDVVADIGYELWVFDGSSAELRPAERPSEPEGNAIAAPRGWRPPRLGGHVTP